MSLKFLMPQNMDESSKRSHTLFNWTGNGKLLKEGGGRGEAEG